jgi:hypothetical protein
MDLESRLQRLEDRAAINDLVVSYFLAHDGDDLQRWPQASPKMRRSLVGRDQRVEPR